MGCELGNRYNSGLLYGWVVYVPHLAPTSSVSNEQPPHPEEISLSTTVRLVDVGYSSHSLYTAVRSRSSQVCNMLCSFIYCFMYKVLITSLILQQVFSVSLRVCTSTIVLLLYYHPLINRHNKPTQHACTKSISYLDGS